MGYVFSSEDRQSLLAFSVALMAAGVPKAKTKLFKPGRPTDPDSREQKRQLVLRTAARMICERGYDRTSLDDIAAAVGVTKPSLYYYIKNKQDILHACRDISQPALEQCRVLAKQKAVPADQRLAAFIENYVAYLTNVFGRLWVHADSRVLPRAEQEKHIEGHKTVLASLAAILRDGQKEGIFRKVDQKVGAKLICNGLSWLAAASEEATETQIRKWTEEAIETFVEAYRIHC